MHRSKIFQGAIFFVGCCTSASAEQLDALDRTFGDQGDGRQIISSPYGGARADAAAVDISNRILLAGAASGANNQQKGAVIRLNKSGSTDQSFGNVLAPMPAGQGSAYFSVIAAKPDGGAIAAGIASTSSRCGGADCWLVCDLDQDGNYNPEFGDSEIPGCIFPLNGLLGAPSAIALQSDGKILIAGLDQSTTPSRGLLVRLDIEGMPDQDFGTYGAWALPSSYFLESGFNDIQVAPDGSLGVAGYYGTSGEAHMLTARLTADGVLQSEFGGGVRVVTFTHLPPGKRMSFATGVNISANGDVLLAGITRIMKSNMLLGAPALAKIDKYGKDVSEFGIPDLPPGQRIIDACKDAFCDFSYTDADFTETDDTILSGIVRHPDLAITKNFAMRISPTGEIDPSFGTNDGTFSAGVAVAWWPEGSLYASTVQDGKVVMAGSVEHDGEEKFAAMRFKNEIFFADSFESTE